MACSNPAGTSKTSNLAGTSKTSNPVGRKKTVEHPGRAITVQHLHTLNLFIKSLNHGQNEKKQREYIRQKQNILDNLDHYDHLTYVEKQLNMTIRRHEFAVERAERVVKTIERHLATMNVVIESEVRAKKLLLGQFRQKKIRTKNSLINVQQILKLYEIELRLISPLISYLS